MLNLNFFSEFKSQNIGFVDIGSMGGVHEMVEPIGSIIKAICFEPDNIEAQKLRDMYINDTKYAEVIIEEVALDSKNGTSTLFVSKTPTNTSLLEPNADFINRYNAVKFLLDKKIDITTTILDEVLIKHNFEPEFVKIDTQGSEFDILKASPKTLESSLGIWCEVEFFEVYKNQKTFTDIDSMLRDYGFCIYGLYPNFRSKKFLDGKIYDTEERLMWADSLFFKDPLDSRNKNLSFSDRNIKVLIILAILREFYDFALELLRESFENHKERLALEKIIFDLAKNKRVKLESSFKNTNLDSGLAIKKFVDSNRTNSDLSYLV